MLHFHDSSQHFFGELGAYSVTHRKTVYFVSFLTVLLLGSGLAKIPSLNETKADKLWVDQESRPKLFRRFVESEFGPDTRPQYLLLARGPNLPSSPFENVLADDVGLTKLFELYSLAAEERHAGYNLTELCAKGVSGQCLTSGAVSLWDSREAFLNSSTKVLDAKTLATPIRRDILFDFADDGPTAKGLPLVLRIARQHEEKALLWEEALLLRLKSFDDNLRSEGGNWRLFYFLGRTLDDELGRTISGDISLNVAAYNMIGLLCALWVSRYPAKKWVGVAQDKTKYSLWWRILLTGSRYGLILQGIVVIVLSTAVGYGFCLHCGVKFVSLHQVLPFILVGIGVDDMFIIVDAFDEAGKEDLVTSLEHRARVAMRRCGMSVTFSSLTNCVCFLLGTTFSYPAVQNFCWYASASIFFDYIAQVTLFVSLLGRDIERMEELGQEGILAPLLPRRIAKKCCRRQVSLKEVSAPSPGGIEAGNVMALFSQDDRLRGFIRKFYAPFVTKNLATKLSIVLIFFGYCGFSLYCATKVTTDFDVIDLSPDDSYMRDYLNVLRATHPDRGQTRFGMYYRHSDHESAASRNVVEAHETEIPALQFVGPHVRSWFQAFRTYTDAQNMTIANGSIEFGQQVWDFLETSNDGKIFQNDVKFNPSKVIIASRVWFFHTPLTDFGARAVSANKEIYAFCDRETRLSAKPEAFSFQYQFYDQTWHIKAELFSNFAFALLGVLLVSLLLLWPYVFSVFLLFLVILMVDIDLTGWIWIHGLDLSSISVINLIMAIGLVVDYSAHIIHSFLFAAHHTQPNDVRVRAALTQMGPNVLKGGATTFCGVLVLGFASSFVFRVFFTMFVGIVGFGLLHGLLLLPCLLSLRKGAAQGNKVELGDSLD